MEKSKTNLYYKSVLGSMIPIECIAKSVESANHLMTQRPELGVIAVVDDCIMLADCSVV